MNHFSNFETLSYPRIVLSNCLENWQKTNTKLLEKFASFSLFQQNRIESHVAHTWNMIFLEFSLIQTFWSYRAWNSRVSEVCHGSKNIKVKGTKNTDVSFLSLAKWCHISDFSNELRLLVFFQLIEQCYKSVCHSCLWLIWYQNTWQNKSPNHKV